MRLKRSGTKKARIEIIPMIDTIFFLLVFFMISTLSMEHYRGLRVNLPKAASGTQAPADNATITLTQDGKVYLNQNAIERTALRNALRVRLERNPELLVLVNADGGVPHRDVVEVMDDARRAGVTKVAIAVKPKEGR